MLLWFIYMFRNVINDHAHFCVFQGKCGCSRRRILSHTLELRAYQLDSFNLGRLIRNVTYCKDKHSPLTTVHV
jgi:hypothetical protein